MLELPPLLPDNDVRTITGEVWAGLSNGVLLKFQNGPVGDSR